MQVVQKLVASRCKRLLLDPQRLDALRDVEVTSEATKHVSVIKNIVVDLNHVHGKMILFHSALEEQGLAINQHSFTRALENLAGNAVKYGSKGKFITIILSSSKYVKRIKSGFG